MSKSDLAINGGKPVRTRPLTGGKKVGKEELKELVDVIDSGMLFRWGGTKVEQLEKEFAKFLGVKHGIASTSGTAALHVAVGMLNLNPGDEVITAPITDIGSIIPIIYQTGIPVFADIDPETFNISAETIEKKISPKTRAIMAVHLFGNPCDMDPIMELAKKHNLTVIEDCSQAHIAEYKGRRVGTIGHIGTYSFQQSKHMTTGDGGMTFTNDDELAMRGMLFADKGWHRAAFGPRKYTLLGLNYRMTELQGAVALAQLRKLEWVTDQRTKHGDRVKELIDGVQCIVPQKVIPGCTPRYWLFGMVVKPDAPVDAATFAKALSAEGVPAGHGYIGKPIFLCHEALQNKQVFGNSHFPFDHPDARKDIARARQP